MKAVSDKFISAAMLW